VQKESAGEVVRADSAARADSIARDSVARADSIARDSVARADSMARAEAARADSVARADSMARDSVARVDSMARAEAARADSMARETALRDSLARADSIAAAAAAAAQLPSALTRCGFYLGLGGGWSTPSGDYGEPWDPGWNATLTFGWQRGASRWGLRGDIAYDSHSGDSFTRNTFPSVIGDEPGFVTTTFDVDNSEVWSGNLDVTLDVFQWGRSRLSSVYLIGGGGVHYFTAPTMSLTPRVGENSGVTQRFEGDSQTKFGLNGGAGIAFAIGRSALFLESRYFTAYTDNTNSDWVPVIIGLKWF
jgi:opacity protein-like surface antigen